jgi:hypothetical protein
MALQIERNSHILVVDRILFGGRSAGGGQLAPTGPWVYRGSPSASGDHRYIPMIWSISAYILPVFKPRLGHPKTSQKVGLEACSRFGIHTAFPYVTRNRSARAAPHLSHFLKGVSRPSFFLSEASFLTPLRKLDFLKSAEIEEQFGFFNP